ncbi:MAG TPA: hypothetical protein VGA32_07420, partial [Anaerolineales bacterium]
MRRPLLPVILLSVAALLACQYFQLPVQPGDVLFQDDFSRSSSGWDRYQDPTYLADYSDGRYRITVA